MRTQFRVFGHIIHFAVPPFAQPVLKAPRRCGDIEVGDADAGEAVILSAPPSDQFGQGCERGILSRFFGVFLVHSPNHSLPASNAAPQCDVSESPRLALHLPDEAGTNALGAALAGALMPGVVVWLDGDLGAGKTTLVRALLRALGHSGPVKSPTYTLVELYTVSSLYLYHFDFYRFNDPEEFDDAGLGEYFRSDSICLVEWPDKAAGHVPQADLAVVFRFADAAPEHGRVVELEARSPAGARCLTIFRAQQAGRFSVVAS